MKTIRLAAISEMVPPSDVVVDIGSDHGLLAIDLLESGKAKHVINVDKAAGPLQAGIRNASASPFSDRITHELSDGFKDYRGPRKVDTVVMAGFGGKAIGKIIGDAKVDWKTIIVQPSNNAAHVRQYCRQHGLSIEDETVVYDRRFYELIKIGRNGVKVADERAALFGPLNLQRKSETFLAYWTARMKHLKKIAARADNMRVITEMAAISEMLAERRDTVRIS